MSNKKLNIGILNQICEIAITNDDKKDSIIRERKSIQDKKK